MRRDYLARISRSRLNAFSAVCAEPGSGLAVAVKDNICTADMPTSCGSKMLQAFNPGYDATAVKRLKESGAWVIGKTNMDEFGMGSSGLHSAFGPVLNPWDASRIAGGSSSGSAVAVAAGLCDAALGSDTGGSIRLPASFCGVTGFKPSYGAVSRYGLVAHASSMDQIGILSRSVQTAADLFEIIAGFDPLDATSLELPACSSLDGLRIGIPFLDSELTPAVDVSFKAALDRLAQQGAELVEIELADLVHALPAYYILASAEASSNLARFDGIRYGGPRSFGPEVRRRILLGTHLLNSELFARASALRQRLCRDVASVFESCDLIAMPTAPGAAPPAAELNADFSHRLDRYCVLANLAYLPAISLPCGFDEGLPLGLQLMARPLSDRLLLSVAAQFQDLSTYHLEAPHGF